MRLPPVEVNPWTDAPISQHGHPCYAYDAERIVDLHARFAELSKNGRPSKWLVSGDICGQRVMDGSEVVRNLECRLDLPPNTIMASEGD